MSGAGAAAPESVASPVPLAGLCLGRTTSIDYIRALIRADRLPAPTGPEELVAPDYLTYIDPDPVPALAADEWRRHLSREVERYRDGRTRLVDALGPDRGRRREQQLMRIASAAWGAALTVSMECWHEAARIWFERAATLYRRSLADAEPGSWGRSIAVLKARLLGDDPAGAAEEARWTLRLGAASAPSPTARYAASLASFVLGEDGDAASLADSLADDDFPAATAAALVAIANRNRQGYAEAVAAVLRTFETRQRFLEDIPVADTVLVLQLLARRRRLDVALRSPVLPACS
jgi:hypothetical protein